MKGQSPRAEEGRLPGLRRRKAAEIKPSRSSTFRSNVPSARCLPQSHRAGRAHERARVRRPRLRDRARRSAHAVARSQRIKAAAKQFIERRLGANDLMAVIHTAGRTSTARNSPATSGCCWRPSTSAGRKLDSATVNKTNGTTAARTRQQGDPLNDIDDAERA